MILCAVILACKAEVCLIQSIHGSIDKAFNILRSCIARHNCRAEGVDRRLDKHIGNTENDALETCRKTDFQHSKHLIRAEFKIFEINSYNAFIFYKAYKNEHA